MESVYSIAKGVAHYGGDPNLNNIIIRQSIGTESQCKDMCNSMDDCTHFDRRGSFCRFYKNPVWLGSDPSSNVYCKGEGPCENGYSPVTITTVPTIITAVPTTTTAAPTTTMTPVRIMSNNPIEFGVGRGKESNAGKIAYQKWSGGLDVVGAGREAGKRQVTIFDGLNVGAPYGDHTASNRTAAVNIRNMDGTYTHFNWHADGKNYIRGTTNVENGELQEGGRRVHTRGYEDGQIFETGWGGFHASYGGENMNSLTRDGVFVRRGEVVIGDIEVAKAIRQLDARLRSRGM